MTFEEWWQEDGLLKGPRTDSEAWDAKKIWQAAQREAARRCAEIALEHESYAYLPTLVAEIEREFGLDGSHRDE